jgi:flavin-dependent dehydrogenase
MTPNVYDAIVIGARCAGSPTAMLLARQGHKVLLLDKDRFPSDTLSTHMVHPPGIARLKEWGLLDRLIATGCPAVERYKFDFGPFKISGRPAPVGDVSVGYGPRRTILDKLLVDAAAEAGAEVRENFTVDEILIEDGRVTGVRGHTQAGSPITEHARIVIGADGRHSLVAKAVGPEQYNEKPIIQSGYYTYWSNLPAEGFEVYIREHRGWGVIPTHDNLSLVVMGWPHAEFEENKKDVEGTYMRSLELAPEFAERVRRATREAPFRGGGVPNFFRKPFGNGWALVGDAGYTKDPVTAWGMSDAFRDAALCSTALDQWLRGTHPFDQVMAGYQQQRDEHSMPMFGVTCNFATLEPPPPEMHQVLGATAKSQQAQDQFVSMMAGTLPVPAFFAPENIGRIMASAAQA